MVFKRFLLLTGLLSKSFLISALTLSQIVLYFSNMPSSSIKKYNHLFFHLNVCFRKHYISWFNFMINIQVANKVLLVFFVKINLADTNTFSISTSPPKNESLVIVKFPFFQFHYCQKLKVLYSFLYLTINC